RRGHRVTLFERSSRLGGLVNLAAVQPEHATIAEVTAYLEAAVRDLNVDIRLGVAATPEVVRGADPDVVVVATGSEPNLPNLRSAETGRSLALGLQALPAVDGLELPHVVAVDDVLSGDANLSGHVVVIDGNGHWEAAGTAEYLADRGCQVTVVAAHLLV